MFAKEFHVALTCRVQPAAQLSNPSYAEARKHLLHRIPHQQWPMLHFRIQFQAMETLDLTDNQILGAHQQIIVKHQGQPLQAGLLALPVTVQTILERKLLAIHHRDLRFDHL